MGAYISTTELERLGLTPDVAQAASVEQKSDAIAAAEAKADSYLSRRYTLPLQQFGADLKDAVASIATFNLATTVALAPEGGNTSNLYLRYKAAIMWLEAVRDGHCDPGIQDSGNIEPTLAGTLPGPVLSAWSIDD